MAGLLREADRAIVLTGAGVSTASGIPDFRSPRTGLWANVDPMKVASIRAFSGDPVEFWSYYRQRLASLADVAPNPAHSALARLEERGMVHGLVTQNVDRLHRRAGSRAVVEVHGSVDFAVCLVCGARYPHQRMVDDLDGPKGIPTCDCGAILKPGVVLFGEDLPAEEYAQAVAWVEEADVLLVAGTSLQVWPVAGLPQLALAGGATLIIVNATPTDYDREATVVERGRVEEVLPALARVLERCASVAP
jgi:NAD-dependent deacetylase